VGLAGDGQIWSINDVRGREEVGADLDGYGVTWLSSEALSHRRVGVLTRL
jgi:hypothetical protein